jgi:polar amino acid transport system substrate-binding protein
MASLFRLALLALAVTPGGADAAPITLQVLAQESIPPKWVAAEGKLSGLCPDILAAIEKIEPRLRFSLQSEPRSLPFLEQGLETGKVNAACALLDTERRRQVADIVGPPLYMVRHRLAARSNDRIAIGSMAELIKLRPLINTQRNAGYANQLRALGLDVDDSTGDNNVNLKKILAGHGRFFYINELTLAWMMSTEPFKGKVRMLDWLVKEEPIYFHVSKKSPAGAAALVDQALVKLKNSGELARIYARWSQSR